MRSLNVCELLIEISYAASLAVNEPAAEMEVLRQTIDVLLPSVGRQGADNLVLFW